MHHDFAGFVVFWQQQRASYIEELYAVLIAELPTYAALPRAHLIASIERKIELWHELLLSGDQSVMLDRTRALVRQRVSDDFPMFEMVRTGDLFRDHVVALYYRFCAAQHAVPDQKAFALITTWERADRDIILKAYSETLDRTRHILEERVQTLEEQRELIHALSTPIVPVSSEVLMLPLVGVIDEYRAMQIMEAVIERVVAEQADTVIVDTTGVASFDMPAARALVMMANALYMVGASMILVGLRPQTSLALLATEVDLSRLTIKSSLQSAIQMMLKLTR